MSTDFKVSDVELKLQRAWLLLCRGHKLWYQRLELVYLIDANGKHPVPCSLRIPASIESQPHSFTISSRDAQPRAHGMRLTESHRLSRPLRTVSSSIALVRSCRDWNVRDESPTAPFAGPNFLWCMSALGQKQTCAVQNVMSAFPRKRTFAVH